MQLRLFVGGEGGSDVSGIQVDKTYRVRPACQLWNTNLLYTVFICHFCENCPQSGLKITCEVEPN